jgi:SAM-dependent methyltransferase
MADVMPTRFHVPELAEQHRQRRDDVIDRLRAQYRWDDVPCVLCGPAAATSHATTVDGIDLRTCDECGHLFVSPRLPEAAVADLYGQAYWTDYCLGIGSPTLAERTEYDYRNGFGKLQRDVLPFASAGRLLDVGASNGGTVRAARDLGFAAQGVEPSADICAAAKEAHGIELYCGDLRDLGLAAGSFDVVLLHDVVEHLFEPLAVLEACRRVLADGGVLVAETPTTDALTYVVDGDNWECMSPLEHVHLFSEENLARLVRRAGFRIADLYCPHEDNVVIVGRPA